MYAGVIFYNDDPYYLEKCLVALRDNNIKPICVDGAFGNFPTTGTFYSNDGCIGMAKKLAEIFIPCPEGGWKSQVDKRNEYFKACPVGEYIIVIDADEVMQKVGGFEAMTEDVYTIMENRYEKSTEFKTWGGIRVYKVYEDLRYCYQHCRTYRMSQHDQKDIDSGLLVCAHGAMNDSRPVLKDWSGRPVTIDHYKYIRTPERMRAKEDFYKLRKEAELGYQQ
jgi:hypothetical protein